METQEVQNKPITTNNTNEPPNKNVSKFYYYTKWVFYYFLILSAIPYAICAIQYSFYYIAEASSWMNQYLDAFCPSYNKGTKQYTVIM